jgi:hypothetical protein
MTTKEISTSIAAFRKAYAAVGEANETGAKRGEVLKRQTEALLQFDNGLAAVVDTVKAIAADHLKEFPRAMPAAGIKRTEDPACVKWDADYKRKLHNPLVQINGALAAAKVAQVIRLKQSGEVSIEAAPVGEKAAKPEAVAKLLERIPYSAAAAVTITAAIAAWEKAGAMQAAKPAQPELPIASEPVSAPTQAEASATGQPTLADLVNLLRAKGVL